MEKNSRFKTKILPETHYRKPRKVIGCVFASNPPPMSNGQDFQQKGPTFRHTLSKPLTTNGKSLLMDNNKTKIKQNGN